MPLLINTVIGGLIILYPIAVYWGIQYLQPWQIAIFLLLLLLLRFVLLKRMAKVVNQWSQPIVLLGVLYCLFVILVNNKMSLLFYPVLINFSLLVIFTSSLFFPPPIIERLARLQHPNLPEQGIRYTRKVTQIWCTFFLINGCLSLLTVLWGDFAFWSLYNGLISYLLMGLLMGGEYLVRIKTQAHLKEPINSENR